MEPVVDHRRDEFVLARHRDLALDHRRDLEDVVRREVLASRVRHVDLPPLVLERLQLRRARGPRTSTSCRSCTCSGRENPPFAASSARSRGSRCGRRRGEIRLRRELDRAVALRSRRSSRRRSRARPSPSRVKPSGKMIRNWRSCLGVVAARRRARSAPPQPATSAATREGYERAADHSSQPERRCAAATASSGAAPAVCCARSVVKRSSNSSTGTSTAARSASANRSVSAACSPRSPRSVSGRPTTIRSASSSRAESRELGESRFGAGLLDDRERSRERPGRVGDGDARARRAVVERHHLHASAAFAAANAAGIASALSPPACAIVGRPPPLPPTIWPISFAIFDASPSPSARLTTMWMRPSVDRRDDRAVGLLLLADPVGEIAQRPGLQPRRRGEDDARRPSRRSRSPPPPRPSASPCAPSRARRAARRPRARARAAARTPRPR